MIRKWLRKIKYYFLKLLRIRKSDHVVAIGFVAGFFHCWFPTFGVGMLMSIALAKLLRGNLAAAIISGSIGSFLWPGLFFLNYRVGFIIESLFRAPVSQLDDAIGEPVPDVHYSKAADHFSSFGDIGLNFLAGSIVNSILFSIIGYVVLRIILKHYRLPLLRKLRRKSRESI